MAQMQVHFMISCLADQFRPSIGHASLQLLKEAGADVTIPPTQTCCGQPAYNAGNRSLAIDLARKTHAEFSKADHIVLPTGSCAGHLTRHIPTLCPDLPPLPVQELSAFLTHTLPWQCPDARKENDTPVTLLDSCAGKRELGLGGEIRQLLTSAGFRIIENDGAEECCGFGGLFSVKYDAISRHIAMKKLAHLSDTGTTLVSGWDWGCLMHLKSVADYEGMDLQFFHFSELLSGHWRQG